MLSKTNNDLGSINVVLTDAGCLKHAIDLPNKILNEP